MSGHGIRYHAVMRIMLTNDDGIDAPGLTSLFGQIADMGELHVVAPATAQSATSHGVTFHRPIRVQNRNSDNGHERPPASQLAVEGRPADCVKLAMSDLVPQPIDLVISGMNAGANVGINVIYSGTVAAAMEAAFLGIPAIAVSLHIGNRDTIDWQRAARYARQAIDWALDGPMKTHSVLNINVPILDDGQTPRGIRVVPINKSPLVDRYANEDHGDGSRSFRVDNSMAFREHLPGTDVEAIFAKYITVTPLHYDLTMHDRLGDWDSHTQQFADGLQSG